MGRPASCAGSRVPRWPARVSRIDRQRIPGERHVERRLHDRTLRLRARPFSVISFGGTSPAERTLLPDRDPDDGSTARLDAYACPDGGAVHAYTLLGGGHTWPNGRQYLPRPIVGSVNRDVDATQAMRAFFTAHPAQPATRAPGSGP